MERVKLFRKTFAKKDIPRISIRSNVIQLDSMGYPLRLCIFTDGKQRWVDSYEREGDVVLEWEKESGASE